ncbi:hypothetical protein Bcoa_2222 [Heyndrickxia coagulans 36D1]|uniref:Uncharacterized protein n=1 Tax=Heyndrickxia coagulans 36D1 TaxID=345219 RepID=G2TP80_HEYCO|nr:hypothetical protein Bcoa_2222 [Heyndrickxia coagulans 36D1]
MKKMSFIELMKDKTRLWNEENVLHRVHERQNGESGRKKCPSLDL